jgi:hypothetical protein
MKKKEHRFNDGRPFYAGLVALLEDRPPFPNISSTLKVAAIKQSAHIQPMLEAT